MTNTKRKGAGKPPRYGQAMKRTQIFLTDEQRKKAVEIGGSISEGVQIAINQYEDSIHTLITTIKLIDTAREFPEKDHLEIIDIADIRVQRVENAPVAMRNMYVREFSHLENGQPVFKWANWGGV